MTTAAAQAALDDAVRAVADATLRARELPPDERARLVAGIDAAVARLTTARASVLVAQRDSGAWRAHGDPSFEAWRARTSRTGARAAATEVRRGDALASMPAVRDAVDDGRVTVEHVDVVARTAAGASAPVRAALASPEGQAELLAMAGRVDAGRFAKAAALWAAALDRAALERGHQVQRGRRFLHLAETPDGTRISGQLDAVTGHRVRLALEAMAGKPPADDDRTPEQRRADALASLADVALGVTSADGVPVGPRATVSFVMREETWAALREEQRAAGEAGTAPASGPVTGARLENAPPATYDGVALPPSELARLLCDCELTRVVIDADGQPLDLGRTRRQYTAGQRRAVTVRDAGCFWPGCGTPTRWCEVHHLVWWDRDGGETDVVDGALACSFHHHELHRLDLAVTRYTVPGAACGPGESRTRYVVATPGGRVLADGRPEDDVGGRVGAAMRAWVPGKGAVDAAGADSAAQERARCERVAC
ncbi:HNH endonuclease signature motif containing protein [Actinotalea fermentans]|uniref:DUF222 domain-containing protein n=1 Tax=Actinotalea fermentans TaxID=43671 RepID=A0A511YWT9_9CELL|nr:HNH endonuclease signature motif containing protein [Actinotalea fermentans]GEN79648.1 hypothetical protein AFE02nite_13820 [Actinotalea fermentans]